MSTLGQGVVIEFEGESYHIAPIGPGVRSNFVKLFKSRAWREMDSQRDIVDPARWQRIEAATAADMALGKYEWGGLYHADVMDNRLGVGLEALARMRMNHPKLTEELVFRMGDTWGWDVMMAKLLSADGVSVPNAKAPPTESAGEQQSTTKNSSESSSNATPASPPK